MGSHNIERWIDEENRWWWIDTKSLKITSTNLLICCEHTHGTYESITAWWCFLTLGHHVSKCICTRNSTAAGHWLFHRFKIINCLLSCGKLQLNYACIKPPCKVSTSFKTFSGRLCSATEALMSFTVLVCLLKCSFLHFGVSMGLKTDVVFLSVCTLLLLHACTAACIGADMTLYCCMHRCMSCCCMYCCIFACAGKIYASIFSPYYY